LCGARYISLLFFRYPQRRIAPMHLNTLSIVAIVVIVVLVIGWFMMRRGKK
jgi:hypothetical protein